MQVKYGNNSEGKIVDFSLYERYKIASDFEYEMPYELMEEIGRKRGCLVRGGIVDYDKVYSVVMNDIKNGIIKGITFDRYE